MTNEQRELVERLRNSSNSMRHDAADLIKQLAERCERLEAALTKISGGRDNFGTKIPLEHLRWIATDAITGAAMEAPSTLETEVRHEIGGAGSPCPCKGHPFNCVNHPHDCGCQAKIGANDK